MTRLKQYLAGEAGAVTVDWVVLTAATVGMGLAVMGVVRDGVEDLSNEIRDHLSNVAIRTTFEEWDTFRTAGGAEAGAEDGADAEAE